MTVMQERETLPGVDDETRQELEAAADAYEEAPARLKAAILDAARKGDSPAKIVKAIRHVYTYDYVARIVRADRKRSQA
jgi:alkylhydroperoxidase family enzyme